jgi:hypothetical protein
MDRAPPAGSWSAKVQAENMLTDDCGAALPKIDRAHDRALRLGRGRWA